jgi:hypothetical protein
MIHTNPEIWTDTVEDLHGYTARVKVEYHTERDTVVTATRTERSDTEPESDMHDVLENEARAAIRRTVGLEELPDE